MRLALAVVVVLAGCSKDAEEYVRKAKMTEAQLHLGRIAKAAKMYAVANDKFPVGTTGPTPEADCCTQANFKCQPDPKQWQKPPWQELDFAVEEPHLYRYTYTSDGKTFTATAIGDLDCDTTTATWTVSGTLGPDGPKTTPIERPTTTD